MPSTATIRRSSSLGLFAVTTSWGLDHRDEKKDAVVVIDASAAGTLACEDRGAERLVRRAAAPQEGGDRALWGLPAHGEAAWGQESLICFQKSTSALRDGDAGIAQ